MVSSPTYSSLERNNSAALPETIPSEELQPLTMRERIMIWDKLASRRVYDASYSSTKMLLIFLEFSGHGGLWLIFPILWYVLRPNMPPRVAASVLNYLALAVVDLAVIGVLKPVVRRPRPEHNRGITAITIHAIDQYSFPSGHATRAGLNAAYIFYLQMLHPETLYKFMRSPLFLFAVVVWAAAVAVSRVGLGRHHIIDVGVGLLLGVMYVAFWHHFWISADTSDSLRRHIRHTLFGSPL